MEKIPTANEFIVQCLIGSSQPNVYGKEKLAAMLKDFASLHVEAAIKAIVKAFPGQMNEADIPYLQKAYPLENIK